MQLQGDDGLDENLDSLDKARGPNPQVFISIRKFVGTEQV